VPCGKPHQSDWPDALLFRPLCPLSRAGLVSGVKVLCLSCFKYAVVVFNKVNIKLYFVVTTCRLIVSYEDCSGDNSC